MIKGFLWNTFEKTGDTGYYIEYKRWQGYHKKYNVDRDKRTKETG